MLTRQELRAIARARLGDTEVLFNAGRYDGAIYLCGYVVELALKARISGHLRWSGFPETNREFEGLQSFKVHDLKSLLKLSGLEAKIHNSYLKPWSTVVNWNPEVRYTRIGSASRQDVEEMIEAARTFLGVIR